ncbi:MAG TPA: MazG family protein [Acidimicrobiia bacterium]|nr:MazG family protein [Acidimicrobiia bacterium]
MSTPRVVVAGLGPAGLDLLVPAARAAIDRIPVRFVRTAQHPAVDELVSAGVEFESLDRLYDAGDDLDTVYSAIASYVVDAALTHGEVLYAVPGSPSVAERTVLLLRAATVEVEIIPGVSFADIAWARVGVDPLGGARVVDARAFAVEAAGGAGPMLIAQCDSQFVLSDVKLALLEMLRPDHEVTVLQRLGLPDERVFTVALVDLDRDVAPDHLTSLFVDSGELAVASELVRLVALAERLRGPGGCPWDAAQTHHSLRRHVIEEAYEVAEAIDVLPPDAPGGDVDVRDYDALEDELGDLLFQVVIQSVLAAETGAFSIADVARRIHDKLIRRHPHVFGDVRVGGADEVVTNWEQIKKSEKGDDSLVGGITASLPSLIAVQKLFRKADSIGLTPRIAGDDVGAALAAIAQEARRNDVDADAELARWNTQFKARFQRMERAARDEGVDLANADPGTVDRLWAAARD